MNQPAADSGEGTTTDRMQRLAGRLGRIAYGGDYNPEQWPEDVWAEDMRLMKEAGVSMASVGIFSWAKVQPRPGEFDFGWFDRVMDNLADAGVTACLATMTASPPPWLCAQHPEMLPVRADGVRLSPGGRQHYCPSSPIYREHAARLVEKLADRYGKHPALGIWHVNNEYGCHVAGCYCDVSAAAFRTWLQARYGDVAALNDAWSTAFWSQQYGDWSEVLPPRVAATFPNPAQQVDFARFSSDALLECYQMEKEILRRATPDVPVTTNFMPFWRTVDAFRWGEHVDVTALDSYPDPFEADAHVRAAAGHDLIRSAGRGKPWLLMEQAPSAVNWRDRNAPKPPGVMRLWSWQAVARGADAVMFFQWRQSRGGAEKYHSAMVPHRGEVSRTFREVRQLGQELAALPELQGTTLRADAALLMDWPSWWGLELDSHPSTDLRFQERFLQHYVPLHAANIICDVAHPSWDLSRYRLVVAPNLYMLSEEAARKLVEYVRGGGHLLVSFFSGVVDEHDRVHLGGYPAPLRELLGLTVEEFWPLPAGGEVGVAFAGEGPRTTGDFEITRGTAQQATGHLWSELITLEGAAAVATFTDGEVADAPAITRHRFGKGTAWYLATQLDPAAMTRVLKEATSAAGVHPALPDLPEGVEATARHAADGTTYHVLLNHSPAEVEVPLPEPMTDLLTRADPSESIRLPHRGVAVVTKPATNDPR